MPISRGVVAGLAAAAALTAGAAPAAADDDFVYHVTARATLQDITGTEVVFRAAAGAAYELTAEDLSALPLSPLRAGDNVGNTFAISCAGPGLGAGAETGGYWAANLVPPQEQKVVPRLRWLFAAPAAGTFTCGLKVASYSTIVTSGRQVAMRIPAGVRLRRSPAPRAERWTQPADSRTLVAAGDTAEVLHATYPLPPGGRLPVRFGQDAALSTCKAASTVPGCGGGTAAADGSTVKTWVRLRPRTAAGADCGTGMLAGEHTISTAKHHLSVTHTETLDPGQLRGCESVQVALMVTHVAGNPVLVHAGHSNGNAATRGYALAGQ